MRRTDRRKLSPAATWALVLLTALLWTHAIAAIAERFRWLIG
jgi:hypothetical protein